MDMPSLQKNRIKTRYAVSFESGGKVPEAAVRGFLMIQSSPGININGIRINIAWI